MGGVWAQAWNLGGGDAAGDWASAAPSDSAKRTAPPAATFRNKFIEVLLVLTIGKAITGVLSRSERRLCDSVSVLCGRMTTIILIADPRIVNRVPKFPAGRFALGRFLT
jgi:hypothetical protein